MDEHCYKRNNIIVFNAYFICTCCLLLMAAFISGISVGAKTKDVKIIKNNSDFKVAAEYGLGGLVMYDNPVQVSVKVESKNDFKGILRVIPDAEYSQVKAAYGKNISLAQGEEKTYTFTINTPNDTGIVNLAILNERDKVVYEERTTLNITGAGQYAVVGILSDDYAGISYFNGVSVAAGGFLGSASTIELTGESFPENQQVLGLLDYIIIDNYDTSSFTKEQYDALKQWVASGGVMILSLGSHYQNVLSGFKDDFVSGTLGNISTKTLKWKTDEDELELSEVECVDFILNGGEKFHTPYGTDQTAYEMNYGMGNVVVLSYSLSMEPVTSYARRMDVASQLLSYSYTQPQKGMGAYGNQYDSVMRLASISEESKVPSALLYGILLTIYIMLVGPILYLILKKIGLREKIWIAIPVISLVFTGIIYCTSFLYRVNKPLLNTFSLIRLSEGSAYESVYSEVVCPRAKQYKLSLSEEYNDFRTGNQYDYSFFGDSNASGNGAFDYMFLDNGTGTEIIFNSDKAFDKIDFSMNRAIPDGVGAIQCDIDCTTSGFTGKVTNNTLFDLADVVVTFENHFYIVGDMKKGETAEIESDEIIDSSGYGVFDELYTQSSTHAYKLYQINDTIENNIIDISKYNQGYVWGTVLSYKTDLMDEKLVKNSGTAVIFDTFSKDYSDIEGVYYSDITYMAVDTQGDYDSNTNMMYGSAVTVTYSFEGYGDINKLTVYKNDFSYGQYADIEAFNMETGDYEPVFTDGDILSGEQLKRYMGHNIIKLKYIGSVDITSGAYSDFYIPRIAAEGTGK